MNKAFAIFLAIVTLTSSVFAASDQSGKDGPVSDSPAGRSRRSALLYGGYGLGYGGYGLGYGGYGGYGLGYGGYGYGYGYPSYYKSYGYGYYPGSYYGGWW